MNPSNIPSLLWDFASRRPGLDFANYGDISSYRKESREITADLHDFRELFGLASSRVPDFAERLEKALTTSSGRLTLENGQIQYCTGQYFPTEYRPAASRAVANILWNDYANETNDKGERLYKDGHEIRKALRRRLSRRVFKNYFA